MALQLRIGVVTPSFRWFLNVVNVKEWLEHPPFWSGGLQASFDDTGGYLFVCFSVSDDFDTWRVPRSGLGQLQHPASAGFLLKP